MIGKKTEIWITIICIIAVFLAGYLLGDYRLNQFGNMVCQRYQGESCIFQDYYENPPVRAFTCLCPINDSRKVIMLSGDP